MARTRAPLFPLIRVGDYVTAYGANHTVTRVTDTHITLDDGTTIARVEVPQ